MKLFRLTFVLTFIISLVGCNQYGKHFVDKINASDSLSSQLECSFVRYNQIDTSALLQMYRQLLKTDQYAGLAFNYQKINTLKAEIKRVLMNNQQIRKDVRMTKGRLQLLKQSLRHNEYDSLTFTSYLVTERNHVKNLINIMDSTGNKMQNWIVHSDSLFSSLHK
jgi:hypothetical protein